MTLGVGAGATVTGAEAGVGDGELVGDVAGSDAGAEGAQAASSRNTVAAKNKRYKCDIVLSS